MDEVKASSLFEKVILPLRDDEYLDGDGLPRCKSCHTLRVYVSDDKTFCARCLCRCQSEQIEKEKELEAIRRNLEEFYDRQRFSLMGDRYKDCRLSTAVITEHNRAAYARAKRYVECAPDMRRENIGLYFYGDNSSGKTYITACICNELLRKGYRCVYTNFARILSEIRSGYSGDGMGELDIMRNLMTCDFAFLDDFGKEFIGREYNRSAAKWAEEKLFEMINARYNSKRPTVFSSNYAMDELASKLSLDKAIIERVNEMSTRVIRLKGDDFRAKQLSCQNDKAIKYGI